MTEFPSPIIFKSSTPEIVQFKNVIWVSWKSYAYFQWKFWLKSRTTFYLTINGVALTISLVLLAIAKRWWQQCYALSSQQIVKRFSERTSDPLVRLQHSASAWYSLESVLLGTHLLFRESQQKQIDDNFFWFAITVVESKLSIDSVAVSLYAPAFLLQ